MQNFEIRKALKNDISAVIELQKEWQEESIEIMTMELSL